jgi:hypothetical protein
VASSAAPDPAALSEPWTAGVGLDTASLPAVHGCHALFMFDINFLILSNFPGAAC